MILHIIRIIIKTLSKKAYFEWGPSRSRQSKRDKNRKAGTWIRKA